MKIIYSASLLLSLIVFSTVTHAESFSPHPIGECAEPFCTYSPPKLTGDAMAEAVREIITTGEYYSHAARIEQKLKDGKHLTDVEKRIIEDA